MRIVKSGRWLYDSSVEKPVDIVALDFDYHYEIAHADGTLDAGEQPQPMGEDGVLYYVRFRSAGDKRTPTMVDSRGLAALSEAIAIAEQQAPSPIRWK